MSCFHLYNYRFLRILMIIAFFVCLFYYWSSRNNDFVNYPSLLQCFEKIPFSAQIQRYISSNYNKMEADHPQQIPSPISNDKIEQNNVISAPSLNAGEQDEWVSNVYSYVPLYNLTLYDYTLHVDQSQNKFLKVITQPQTSQAWVEVPLGQQPIDNSYAYIRLNLQANKTANAVEVRQAADENSNAVTTLYIYQNIQTNTYQIVGTNLDFENIQSYSYTMPVTSIYYHTVKYDWRSAKNMIGYRFGLSQTTMAIYDPVY